LKEIVFHTKSALEDCKISERNYWLYWITRSKNEIRVNAATIAKSIHVNITATPETSGAGLFNFKQKKVNAPSCK